MGKIGLKIVEYVGFSGDPEVVCRILCLYDKCLMLG